ncbi:MAG: DUF192 domain-containing protein [Methylococcales symbiont of Hymedesmia sp. n. MRB-2018]|nr:MAG: DUF192 domain-containing protein [Methylococcales symbiont of Hymedesmia sp. n. MRB-2018]
MYAIKNSKKILLSFLLLAISLSSQGEEKYKKFGYGQLVFIAHNFTIEVEVASTKRQRTIGLMFREYLAPNKGMLFVFDEEVIQRVWMRNTFIPLDIIYISAEGKIVSILKDLKSCDKEPCPIHSSNKKAKYMLEINAGIVDEKGIAVAEKINFSGSNIVIK